RVNNRTIHVIPTKNVPQGFAAALVFNPDVSVPENKTNMTHAIDNVAAGQVTYAVRTTTMNGFKLKEGDIIGLNSKKILAKSDNIDDTTLELIKKMKNNEHEMVTLYYGEGVDEGAAEALAEKVGEAFPDCEVDVHYGGQPVYYYIVSLE
ncbi:MAG: DAK2 domain-containing protein, partial [Clostridia bacterium]|nr:DAK2 domain-containing protein [Clostridia bacterium]